MNRLAEAVEIAEFAGEIAKVYFDNRHSLAVEAKNTNDFVSNADKDTEKFVRLQIEARFENDGILGEECGGDDTSNLWVVDPIDGTSNFLRGSPLWGISLAYVSDLMPKLGVLHFPTLQLTISGGIGLGLTKNGEIFERPQSLTDHNLIAVGDSAAWNSDERNHLKNELQQQGFGEHAYRCCSIGMAYAALGYVDGYVERNLSIWDAAAGIVICKEAGLEVRYDLSTEPNASSVVVGTKPVVSSISDIIPEFNHD